MDLFQKAFKDLTPVFDTISKKGKQAYSDISNKIQDLSNENSGGFQNDLIEIVPRIYWMPFPESNKIGEVGNYLNSNYGSNYFIWNVSEHKYNIDVFNSQVAEYCSGGFPNPGLMEILVISQSILSWVNNDNQNIAIVHCQNTRGRSALIISCVLCLSKQFVHPGQALTFFCKQTKTQDAQILFSSQKLYLNYFANILTGVQLNTASVQIKRVIFSQVPRVVRRDEKGKQQLSFRPYLQLFQGTQILYNSLNTNQVVSYYPSDMTVWFDMGGIQVSEDILFRCKHFHSNALRYPAFRMMLHSGFAHDNIIRLMKKDIDLTNNIQVSDGFFIDIIFEESSEEKKEESPQEEQQTNNQNQSTSVLNQTMDIQYIVSECNRKIEQQKSGPVRPPVVDEKSQEIERILNQNIQVLDEKQATDTSKFSISDEVPNEKENRSSVGSNQSPESTKNELASKLLSQIHKDHQLDDQQIDDYLQGLEQN